MHHAVFSVFLLLGPPASVDVVPSTSRRSLYDYCHTISFPRWQFWSPFPNYPSCLPDHGLTKHSNTPSHALSFHSLKLFPSESSPILKSSPLVIYFVQHHIDVVARLSVWLIRSTFNTWLCRPADSEMPSPGPSHALDILHSFPEGFSHHVHSMLRIQVVFRRPEPFHLPSTTYHQRCTHIHSPGPSDPYTSSLTARIPCFLFALVPHISICLSLYHWVAIVILPSYYVRLRTFFEFHPRSLFSSPHLCHLVVYVPQFLTAVR